MAAPAAEPCSPDLVVDDEALGSPPVARLIAPPAAPLEPSAPLETVLLLRRTNDPVTTELALENIEIC